MKRKNRSAGPAASAVAEVPSTAPPVPGGQPDIQELARENLPEGSFPVQRQETFRVCFAEAVHAGIRKHACEDMTVEICGVLVGRWMRDADGPFASITEFIRCDSASRKFAEVTFTHESWAEINKEMDSRFQDERIIGWYHTHPNFGIFLSDRDCFIQQHFFGGPGQVAYVVDPVRKTEGVFEWRQGKPVPMHHFWVGNRLQIGEGTVDETTAMDQAGPRPEYPPISNEPSLYSWVGTLLLSLSFFLVGYLLAGLRSAMEYQTLAQHMIAHYGLWQGVKPGLDFKLKDLESDQARLAKQLRELSEQDPAKLTEEQLEAHRERWKQLQDEAESLLVQTGRLRKLYLMTDSEQAALANLHLNLMREFAPEGTGWPSDRERMHSDRKREKSTKPKEGEKKNAVEKSSGGKPSGEKPTGEDPDKTAKPDKKSSSPKSSD
jgi:proteasome lid subunit RPN8/RPN11